MEVAGRDGQPNGEGGAETQSDPILPNTVTSGVLQALIRKKCPPGYRNLGLSQHYPRGFFEAVEALTFITEPSWHKAFIEEFTEAYFAELWLSINKLYVQNALVSPPSRKLLFSAFNLTPLDKVKVVIPAVAPLHGRGYTSDGLAFSALPAGHTEPPDWGVFKLLSFVHPPPSYSPSNMGSLQAWAKQGVLLWNMTLISQPEDADRIDMNLTYHAQSARNFYLGVAEILNRECKNLVFLFFQVKNFRLFKRLHQVVSEGGHTIVQGPALNALQNPHAIVRAPMKCFWEVNSNLEALGKTPVDWMAL